MISPSPSGIQKLLRCWCVLLVLAAMQFSLLHLAHREAFADKYQPNWQSLSDHEQSPEWFRNAKFGIYFHWGPYAVPAFGNEHYPRTMYGHVSGKTPKPRKAVPAGIGFQTYREHEFHKTKFGDPKDFEYHDLFPLFTAECFDPEEWADLFFLSGAKFAGPVAMHHDGFAMWDSDVTPWNSVNHGLRRDVVGEIAQAIRKRGLKLVTTFHHAKVGQARPDDPDKNRWHYLGRQKYFEREFPEGYSKDSSDLQKLYGTLPWADFLEMWKSLLSEVVNKYEPDIVWFDSWLDRIPEQTRREFLAEYFNRAHDWGKQVVVTYKQEDLPSTVGVVDYEKGRLDRKAAEVWLTDDTISAGPWTTTGSWSYTEELDIKSSETLLRTLIDIVSKNGNLLLNISPTASGLIPREQKESLLGMGRWLRANGEAIYGTRPFVIYGEGPKRLATSGHFVEMDGVYDQSNIRFTTRDNVIYAIQLGWPGSEKEVSIVSLGKSKFEDLTIDGVTVLDSYEEIKWVHEDGALRIYSPFRAPNKTAICYRIQTNGGWRAK